MHTALVGTGVARHARRVAPVTALALLLCLGLPATAANALQSVHSTVVSDDPVNWTPHVLDGRVKAIMQVGNRVIVGGTFTQVRSATKTTVIARRNLFAFNAATGVIDAGFQPAVDGPVEALAAGPDGQTVFVGGAFGSVNGVASRGLVKLDTVSGATLTGFRAPTDVKVTTLALSGSRLFAGGPFSTIRGVARSGLAAVDITTGKVDATVNVAFTGVHNRGVRSVEKLDVTPDGTRLVAVGNFTHAGGQDRRQLAVLNLATKPASVADWQTSRYAHQCSSKFNTYMRDVDIAPDGSYFVIATTGAYRAGSLCDAAARFELGAVGSGLQPTWIDYTGGDTLYSVAITRTAIYIGGHQRWMNNSFAADKAGPGAVARSGIAAVDPSNGLPLSWNPGRSRGVGAFDLYATPAGLWVGSDTDSIGGETHGRVALLPLAGGKAIPAAVAGTLPGDLFAAGTDDILVPLAPGTDDTLTRRTFDGVATGRASAVEGTGVAWSQARGAFMLSGKLYTGWADGTLSVRDFDGGMTGPATTLPLYGLTAFSSALASATGMFFDAGRLYYTVAGDPQLYYRYFTPESGIVGADQFVASGNGDGFDWRTVTGLTMSSGRIYYGASDGHLRSVTFSAGRPVAGTTTVLGGPVTGDGSDWRTRGLFVYSGSPPAPVNVKPTVKMAATCSGLDCEFSSAGSTDSDGTIVGYHWNFGDATQASGESPSHTYEAAGIYTVRLVLTDDGGATASRTMTVTVG